MLPYVLWTTLITLLITFVLMRLRERVNLPGSYILTGSIICFAFTVLFPVGLRYVRPLTAVAAILAAGLLAVLVTPRFIEKGREDTFEANTNTPGNQSSSRPILDMASGTWSLVAARLKKTDDQSDLPSMDADFVEQQPAMDTTVDSAVIAASYIDEPGTLVESEPSSVPVLDEAAALEPDQSNVSDKAAVEVLPGPVPDSPVSSPFPDLSQEVLRPEIGYGYLTQMEPALDEVAAAIETGMDEPVSVVERPIAFIEEAGLSTLAVESPTEAAAEVVEEILETSEQPEEPLEALIPAVEETTVDSLTEVERVEVEAVDASEAPVYLDERFEAPLSMVGEPVTDALPVEQPTEESVEEPVEAARDLVEDEQLEGPIVVPLSLVEEDLADTPPVEEPTDESKDEPVDEPVEVADPAESRGDLFIPSPAPEEAPAPVMPEQAARTEPLFDLMEEPDTTGETDVITEPVPPIGLKPKASDSPTENAKDIELVDIELGLDPPLVSVSDPESGLVLPAEPDNYLGREYMANEKPEAMTAPPVERRPLNDLINEGFDAKEQGRWEEAVSLFKQALETNRHPDLSVLLVLEVTCQYRDHGLYQQAIDFINGFLSLQGGLLDITELGKIKNELFYVETVYSLLKQSGTPDLPSSKIPRLIRIKAEELFLQKKV